jgi:hypothetical protein
MSSGSPAVRDFLTTSGRASNSAFVSLAVATVLDARRVISSKARSMPCSSRENTYSTLHTILEKAALRIAETRLFSR